MLVTLLVICALVVFVAIGVGSFLKDTDESPIEDDMEENPMAKSIRDLDLPKRAVNALESEGIHTVHELQKIDDLTTVSGIGETYATEIEEQLKEV